MKHSLLSLAGLALIALACDKNAETVTPVTPEEFDYSNTPVRIDPLITKVTETDFENGDAIGLTVTREAGVFATNEQLSFDGTAFSGSLKWYAEGAVTSTLTAYYPYAAEIPTSFTVAADQTAGTASSDFVAAKKEGVLPTANAVTLQFQHKLSRVVLNLTNNAGYTIEGVTLSGAIPTATLSADFEATVDNTVAPADIQAFQAAATQYHAVVVPQNVAFVVTVTASGVPMAQQLTPFTLLPGKQYTVDVVVNPADIQVVVSGNITAWENGGPIGEYVVPFEEHLDENYFLYDNVQYAVKKMGDNKWWMCQNLAYVPLGSTPSSDLTAVTNGIFYPLKVNAGNTALEFTTDAEVIAAKGYLYQAEFALGLKVGDLTTVAAAQALEGAQGICPTGWHIPTGDDIIGLVGKSVGLDLNADAPYYDATSGNGSIVLLNEAGFNMDAFGAVTIQDNTKTTGSFMGWASGYPSKISSGMFCGSTYAGVTYNTSNTPESGIKNLQFYGLMPMTNKAAEAQYTCNGTKVSYRIAAPVRCVRDAE